MAAIEKRGESSYRLTVSCGYDTQGKQIRKFKTVDLSTIPEKKREEEAHKQWVLFKESIDTGTYLDASKITLSDFIARWRDNYANSELENSTLYGYNVMIDQRIIPALGHIKLGKLQPTHLMEFYNNLREDGIRLDSKCKPKSNANDLIRGTNILLKDLVEKSGVSDKVFDRIRLGQNINRASAIKVCEAVKMKFDTLFEVVSKTGGLSNNYIKHHHEVLSSILQDAVEWQILLDNPANRVSTP